MYRIRVVRAPSDTIGDIVIRLFPSMTPLHVRNFDSIARAGRYDQTAFHRVIPDFVIQGGDPNSISGPESSWGSGDPSQPNVKAEFTNIKHLRGRVGMARSTEINSATSQFYICHGSPTFLDTRYTVFGETVSGFNVIDTVALAPRNASDRPLTKLFMIVTYDGEDTTRPGIPVPLTPAMNATKLSTTVNTPFTWTAGSESLRSIIEISADPLFSSDVIADTVESPTTSVVLPTGLTTFYWRVRADNGGALSDWSTTFVLTTGVAAPPLVEPANGATNTSAEPTLRWEALTVQGATYRLQVATSSVFQASQMVLNLGGLATSSHLVTGLSANKKYFWRVNATVNGDSSVFSKPYAFTTGASTGVDNEVLPVAIDLMPSPVRDMLTVNVRPQPGTPARISVIDLTGTVVIEWSSDIYSETESSVHINCAHLVPGLYAVRCLSGDTVTQRMFVKY
jgi:peptidyl-prolyl cis-trans isomerase B (cyclophilin B)